MHKLTCVNKKLIKNWLIKNDEEKEEQEREKRDGGVKVFSYFLNGDHT